MAFVTEKEKKKELRRKRNQEMRAAANKTL